MARETTSPDSIIRYMLDRGIDLTTARQWLREGVISQGAVDARIDAVQSWQQ